MEILYTNKTEVIFSEKEAWNTLNFAGTKLTKCKQNLIYFQLHILVSYFHYEMFLL